MRFKDFLIKEGVLDNKTTLMSRVVVNNIKKHLDKIQDSEGNLQLIFAKNSQGFASMQKSARHLGLVSNTGSLEIPPELESEFPNMMVYVVKGDPSHSGYFDRVNNVLFIQIGVPEVDGKLDLNATLPMIKAVIRHELEHSEQSQSAPFTRVKDYKWPDTTVKAPWSVSFAEPSGVEEYLTHPSEIEAWVSGLYKYAKTAKIPFSSIVEKQLARIRQSMAENRVDPQRIEEIIQSVKDKWMSFARFRYPRAI